MTKEQLIELVKYTAGEILAPTDLSTEDAESIVDDFIDIEQLTIPDVVGRSEQLKCHHQYMNAGTLQGEAMKKCLKCSDYVKAL